MGIDQHVWLRLDALDIRSDGCTFVATARTDNKSEFFVVVGAMPDGLTTSWSTRRALWDDLLQYALRCRACAARTISRLQYDANGAPELPCPEIASVSISDDGHWGVHLCLSSSEAWAFGFVEGAVAPSRSIANSTLMRWRAKRRRAWVWVFPQARQRS
jgi:hypothetical protein